MPASVPAIGTTVTRGPFDDAARTSGARRVRRPVRRRRAAALARRGSARPRVCGRCRRRSPPAAATRQRSCDGVSSPAGMRRDDGTDQQRGVAEDGSLRRSGGRRCARVAERPDRWRPRRDRPRWRVSGDDTTDRSASPCGVRTTRSIRPRLRAFAVSDPRWRFGAVSGRADAGTDRDRIRLLTKSEQFLELAARPADSQVSTSARRPETEVL